MKTKILRITKRGEESKLFYTIYFDYFGEERFTYLNKTALKYWKEKGLKDLKVGKIINIIQIGEKHFKIVGFDE